MGKIQEKGISEYVGGRGKSNYQKRNRLEEETVNYCRLRGGKGIGRWWGCKVGHAAESESPRCGEEEETPDHIVFRCKKGMGAGE